LAHEPYVSPLMRPLRQNQNFYQMSDLSLLIHTSADAAQGGRRVDLDRVYNLGAARDGKCQNCSGLCCICYVSCASSMS
jgi:hypothetical protein